MAPPYTIIDPYNLTITLLITIAWQITGFAIAWTLQFDKITEWVCPPTCPSVICGLADVHPQLHRE